MPADGSIGSPLSTVGLVTSISDIINAWSGTDTCECFDLKLLRQLRRSHCQSQILTRSFPAQLKYLFQVQEMSYCFPTEYYFDQVRAPSHLDAVALLTILVVRSDAQTVFFYFDIRKSALEPRYINQVWC